MTNDEFVLVLVGGGEKAVSAEVRTQLLQTELATAPSPEWIEAVALGLRTHFEINLRNNLSEAIALAEFIILLGRETNNTFASAVGHWSLGSAQFIGQGEYTTSLTSLNTASAQLLDVNNPILQARVDANKMGPLVSLGRFDEAEQFGQSSRAIFLQHQEWLSFVRASINLSTAIYERRDKHLNALTLLDEAEQVLIENDLANPTRIEVAAISQNRANSLRGLGRLDEALQAGEQAHTQFSELNIQSEANRARQSIATTYMIMGRFNTALQILHEVKDKWKEDGRLRDADRADLFIAECYLRLHNYYESIEKCLTLRMKFRDRKTPREESLAELFLAHAYVRLEMYQEAEIALLNAKASFDQQENQYYSALTDLNRATLVFNQQQYLRVRILSQDLIDIWTDIQAPQELIDTHLLLAHTAIELSEWDRAENHLQIIVKLLEESSTPRGQYQAHELRGDILSHQQSPEKALQAYDNAIDIIELLKGQMIVEYRVKFSESNYAIYEKATNLCIQMGNYTGALEYAERAKSRALLDLIFNHVNLKIEAENEEDAPLIAQIHDLKERRDQIYRQIENSKNIRRIELAPSNDVTHLNDEIATLEKEIKTAWHQLLIRNTKYAESAGLWQVHIAPIQENIPKDTLLIEFYSVKNRWLVFIVTTDSVETKWLGDIADVNKWIHFLQMNCRRAIPNRDRPILIESLTKQAIGFLNQLHEQLITPIAHYLDEYENLIIVPHGSLHRLPFHALHNGENYLIETHSISYLPNSSLLGRVHPPTPTNNKLIAFGYSNNNELPYTIEEVQQIQEIMGGETYIEESATLTNLHNTATDANILHLATHSNFNPDNPIFSGLTLADGQLITLDIFSLKLNASLVTLSACQTGANNITKVDELLGLLRAFMSAGAQSILLTHWPIEDISAAQLMNAFYTNLNAGLTKRESIQQAQLKFINLANYKSHPYFWATYYLIGDPM